MRTSWLTGSGLALVALGLWLLLVELMRPDNHAGSVGEGAHQPAPPHVATADPGDSPTRAPVASGSAATASSESVLDRVRIVVESFGGAVVGAGVSVAWCDDLNKLRDSIQGPGAADGSRTLFDMLRQCGAMVITDSTGTVLIEPRRDVQGWAAACVHDSAYGEVISRGGQPATAGEYRITLWPHDRFTVSVKDEHGNPVAYAPLALEWCPKSPSSGNLSLPLRETIGKTDAAGTFCGGSKQHYARLLERHDVDSVCVVHDAPGCDVAPIPVDLHARAVHSIALESRQVARVRVRTTDDQGTVAAARGRIVVDPRDARRGQRSPWYFVLDDGVVEFAAAVGSVLDVTFEGRNGTTASTCATLPSRPGNTIAVDLRIGSSQRPGCRLRVQDSAGTWLAHRGLIVSVVDVGDRSYQLRVRTDEQGRASWSAPDGVGKPRHVSVFAADGKQAASVAIAADVGDDTDLGVVVLLSATYGGAFRVVDEHGRPVPAAQVVVENVDGDAGRREEIQVVFVTERYELYGSTDFQSVAVRVSAKGYCDGQCTIRNGQGDEVVRMFEARVLRITLIVDHGVPRDSLIVRARKDGREAASSLLSLTATAEEGHSERWTLADPNCPAGDYVLSVHALAVPFKIIEERVTLKADDGSIPEIDVRGRVRVVLLRLYDHQRRATAGYVWSGERQKPDRRLVTNLCRIAERGTTLVVRAGAMDVYAAAPGCSIGRRVIDADADRCEITLARAARVGEALRRQTDVSRVGAEWQEGPVAPTSECRVWQPSVRDFARHTLQDLLVREGLRQLGNDECLFPGRYRVRSWAASGQVLFEGECVVGDEGTIHFLNEKK